MREARVQIAVFVSFLYLLGFAFVLRWLFINFNGLYVRLCVWYSYSPYLSLSVPRCHHARRFPALRERNGKFCFACSGVLTFRGLNSIFGYRIAVGMWRCGDATPHGRRSATEQAYHRISINRIVIELFRYQHQHKHNPLHALLLATRIGLLRCAI